MTDREDGGSRAPREGIVEVSTTVESAEQARDIARAAVEERLAACGTWDPVRSAYRWQGRVPEEDEVRLTLKTSRHRADALVAWMGARHPYEVPMILRREDVTANAEYERWVEESTSAGSDERKGGSS